MPFNQNYGQRGFLNNRNNNANNNAAGQTGGRANGQGARRQNPVWQAFQRQTQQMTPQFRAPQQNFQPPPQQAPPQQPQPQQARQNSNAPQPERKEPIDPELLKALQEAAAKEDAEIMKAKGVDVSQNLEELAVKLALFAQNEKNGAEFYQFLSTAAPTEQCAGILSQISRACASNGDKYAEMHERVKGERPALADKEIRRPRDFQSGLNTALNEEAGYLADMTALYETAGDEKIARRVNALILRKISDLQILGAMRALIK